MRPRVVHLIQRVSRGGAGRALTLLTSALTEFDHSVLALDPSPGRATLRRELAAADLVHVHFWNTPELYELLDSDLPPMRMLLWPHVNGRSAPHVLTPELVSHADLTIACTPLTLELPGLGDLRVIPGIAGWARIEGVEGVPHRGFRVGYMGTVNFTKMHPGYVPMSAAVEVPGVRFPVYGSGAAFPSLAAQANAAGVADRFELRGWADDIRSVFAELDVFGYPLREDNFSASDIVLQEAMYSGVPPVVLPHGGAARLVEHGRSGLIAADEDDYTRSIEKLYHSRALRERLAAGAREHARRTWAPEAIAGHWTDIYARVLANPRRERPPLFGGGLDGADLFVRTLGGAAPQFELGDERAIANSSPVLLSADAGGLLHYRRRYPDDRQLAHWAGLALLRLARAAA
jgi:glycosyltransferase involved in cell wall biosynthesis